MSEKGLITSFFTHLRSPVSLAVFNGDARSGVLVDFGKFLKKGDKFRLMSAKDFYGKPVLSGQYAGRPVRVPVVTKQRVGSREVSAPTDFAAFVVLKERATAKE